MIQPVPTVTCNELLLTYLQNHAVFFMKSRQRIYSQRFVRLK